MFLAPKFGVVEHHYVIGLELGLPCVAYDFLNDFYTPKFDPFGPPKMAMINRTIKSSSNSIQAHFLGSQVSQVPINYIQVRGCKWFPAAGLQAPS